MKTKRHILIFIDWYLPGYKAGGPIQSCANLVNHLKPFYNFSIVTRNTDFGETKPYLNVKSDEWVEIEEGIRLYYISADKLNPSAIKTFLTSDYDALYLNSLFSIHFTLLPLWYNKAIKKVIVAPRGMLGKGALAIKSFKKKLFLIVSRLSGLYSKVTWHASTPLEADEIKTVFGEQAKIVSALNLPPVKTLTYFKRTKQEGSMKLFFLSRISLKKNLLAVFGFLKQVDRKINISFDIIGPVEDESYWKQCQREIDLLKNSNPNLKTDYLGPIENDELQKRLSSYHAMILPTFNENFGHAIADALASGCPVIISDQTPWKNLAERKVGWDISLDDNGKFVNAIETIASMNEEAFNELSLNAFNEAVRFYNDKDIVAQNVKIFG